MTLGARFVADISISTIFLGVTKAIFSVGKVIRREHITPEQENAAKDPEFVAVLNKALQEHARREKRRARYGLLGYSKQDGCYVDLDDKMKAVSPSIAYNADWFEMISQYAREAIDDMARAEPSMHEIMAIIYDMGLERRMSGEERRKIIKRILESLNRLGVIEKLRL